MRHLSLYPILILVIIANGCRTTRDDSASKADTGVAAGKVTGSLALNETESEKLYLKLLSMELAAGIKVPQESLHTSRGLLVCRQDGILKSCTVQARLIGDTLSSEQSLDRELTEQFWAHAKRSRPELDDSKVVVADLVCDYIGPKSPPYNMEKASCEIHHARHSDEVIVSERMAEKLAHSLRGEQAPSHQAQHTLRGTVVCRSVAENTPCMTRGFEGDALSEKIRELDPATSRSLHRMLVRADRDHAMLSAKGKHVSYRERQEILGKVECHIDLSKPDVYGGHICKIGL